MEFSVFSLYISLSYQENKGHYIFKKEKKDKGFYGKPPNAIDS